MTSLSGPREDGFAAKQLLVRFAKTVLVSLRMLLGAALILSGWIWLTRPDPAGYLTDAATQLMGDGWTVGFYAPFLGGVVLPNAGLFAFLVSWGETLSGVSLFTGTAVRVGAAVICFQFVNYGLMGGYRSLSLHLILVGLVAMTAYVRTSRIFGVDRWLHRRWPKGKLW